MRLSAIALFAALSVTGAAYAQDATTPAAPGAATAPMTVTDPQDFANKATVSNMFEIESSKLALQKASGNEAKSFAQHMIDDHTKAGEEMKAAAAAQGVTVPTALDANKRAMLDQLNGLSGEGFDSAYLSMQLAAHQEAVALFDAYAMAGAEGDLRNFAAKTLPTLQSHLAEVSKIAQAGDAAMDADTAPTASDAAAPATDANMAASESTVQAPTSILATGYAVTDKDNLATEIIGKQVYSSDAADAEHIGDVNNIIVGDGGQVAAVVIGVGGFLGIGEKNVAVNYSELNWVVAADNTERFVLPTSKEALEAAPGFETTDSGTVAN